MIMRPATATALVVFLGASSVLFAGVAAFLLWRSYQHEPHARAAVEQERLWEEESARLRGEVEQLQVELNRARALMERAEEALNANRRALESSAAAEAQRGQTAEELTAQRDAFLAHLQALVAKIEGARTESGLDRVAVVVPNRHLFAGVEPVLTAAARQWLKQTFENLGADWSQMRLEVVSHTDSDPVRVLKERFPGNWDLSAARAAAVVRFLTETKLVPAASVLAIGRADALPPSTVDAKDAKPMARRTELILIFRVPSSQP